jgi:hypothetical protein
MTNELTKDEFLKIHGTPTAAVWVTQNSHPASRTAYQEMTIGSVVWARVTVNGREIVKPRRNLDLVHQGYNNLVNQAISSYED